MTMDITSFGAISQLYLKSQISMMMLVPKHLLSSNSLFLVFHPRTQKLFLWDGFPGHEPLVGPISQSLRLQQLDRAAKLIWSPDAKACLVFRGSKVFFGGSGMIFSHLHDFLLRDDSLKISQEVGRLYMHIVDGRFAAVRKWVIILRVYAERGEEGLATCQ